MDLWLYLYHNPPLQATVYPVSTQSLMFVFSLVPGLLLYNLWCLDFEGTVLFPEIYYEVIALFPKIYYEFAIGSQKKQESSRKTSTFALLTTPKLLTVWITTNW